jgi:putative thioredoxin
MQGDFNFQQDVILASQSVPVLVDFWAAWCAPCKILGPVLEKLVSEANGSWKLVKINTEEYPDLATQFRIQSIPAVKMFANGQVIADFVGALPEAQIRSWLAGHIPTEAKITLAKAKSALADHDESRAKNLLEKVIELEPAHAEAKLLLAKLIIASDPQRANDLVQDIAPQSPVYSEVEGIMTLARFLNNFPQIEVQAQAAGYPEAWRHYVDGIHAFRKQDPESALRSWIEALLVDRHIDDDGPRKACVALFDLLGPQHELRDRYHRQFTSALF